jgi:ATP-binding cassette subfamily B protein
VDRVIVLQEGRLVEEGSHEELVAKNGVYASMYEAQSKWYAESPIVQHS